MGAFYSKTRDTAWDLIVLKFSSHVSCLDLHQKSKAWMGQKRQNSLFVPVYGERVSLLVYSKSFRSLDNKSIARTKVNNYPPWIFERERKFLVKRSRCSAFYCKVQLFQSYFKLLSLSLSLMCIMFLNKSKF